MYERIKCARVCLENNSGKRDAKKENGNHDSSPKDYLINASFGTVDIAGTAKSYAEARALLLEEHGRDQKHGERQMGNGDDFCQHNLRVPLKNKRV
jgi:hypothetical protein